MSEFKKFSEAIRNQFNKLSEKDLFVVAVDKNDLWDHYLASFPEGTNPLYKERSEHDCQCCKQFIRAIGHVVTLGDKDVETVWDVEIEGFYGVVAKAMAHFVRNRNIESGFLRYEKNAGQAKSLVQQEDGTVLTFNHFSCVLPSRVVVREDSIATTLGQSKTNFEVLKRSIVDIHSDAIDTVLELIDQNSIYRGDEHRGTVVLLKRIQDGFNSKSTDREKELFLWKTVCEVQNAGRIRNTVIGSLLVDLSEGKELSGAVKSFEDKVAPTNYKRTTAVITKTMITQAQTKIADLGYEDALQRRYAVTDDLTINNVIYADRSVKKEMDVFDTLLGEAATAPKKLDKVEEIGVQEFIEKIVPKSKSIELLVENTHEGNFVSVIAPVNPDSKNMLKWDNNFTWNYNGEVADSMKARVKAAGGNVTGDVRCSLSWASRNDLDLHVIEPGGEEIYFSHSRSHKTGGFLDVDNTSGGTKENPVVENICWPSKSKMLEGEYRVGVKNYSGVNTNEAGFDLEMEFAGTLIQMNHAKPVKRGSTILCVVFDYTHAGGVVIKNSLPASTASKKIWGIDTNNFTKVNMIMNSPNHWDDNSTGNKHLFFVLENCNSGEKARGFYNEFLNEELTPHRKVFEVLGSKLKAEESDDQLSGLGFSSTQRNHAYFKVDGAFSRTIKVNF